MITGYIEKAVNEKYTLQVQYEGRLPTGTTLKDGTIEATLADTGVVDNSVIGSTTATISGDAARVLVQNGTASQDYFLTFLTTLSDDAILSDVVLMKVSA